MAADDPQVRLDLIHTADGDSLRDSQATEPSTSASVIADRIHCEIRAVSDLVRERERVRELHYRVRVLHNRKIRWPAVDVPAHTLV